MGQHGAFCRVCSASGVQCFKGIQPLALVVTHLIQHIDAVVCYRRRDRQCVNDVANLEAWWYRQCAGLPVFIVQRGVQQTEDTHDHGGRVVAAARSQRRIHQLAADCLRIHRLHGDSVCGGQAKWRG